MRNGAVSSKSLVPRRSRMKEFCGDDVEVCQPSVGGLLAAGAAFRWDLKYWRNYIAWKSRDHLNNHEHFATHVEHNIILLKKPHSLILVSEEENLQVYF